MLYLEKKITTENMHKKINKIDPHPNSKAKFENHFAKPGMIILYYQEMCG